MVSSITSLSGRGLRDWLVQRVTAIILAVYGIFLLVFYFLNHDMTYAVWHSLFMNPWMKIGSVLALSSIVLHGWIGVWTVTTDYLNSVCVRLSVQVLVGIAFITMFFWGIKIFWGL